MPICATCNKDITPEEGKACSDNVFRCEPCAVQFEQLTTQNPLELFKGAKYGFTLDNGGMRVYLQAGFVNLGFGVSWVQFKAMFTGEDIPEQKKAGSLHSLRGDKKTGGRKK